MTCGHYEILVVLSLGNGDEGRGREIHVGGGRIDWGDRGVGKRSPVDLHIEGGLTLRGATRAGRLLGRDPGIVSQGRSQRGWSRFALWGVGSAGFCGDG